jgi:hypothetical protein
MPTRYEAKALKKCQFQGLLWRPGQAYEGYMKPPEEIFRITKTTEVTAEAIAKSAAAEKKKKQEKTPSDPTPKERPAEPAEAIAEAPEPEKKK